MPQYRLPSQSLVSLYFFLMHSMSWSMSSCHVYFTPKLLTTSVSVMGCVACHQRPGVCTHLKYPWGARCFLSSLLARIPAWGRPHTARHISMYMCPLRTLFCRAYCSTIQGGNSAYGIRMYSKWSSGADR